ncbi:MAG: hypothetical protein IPO29_12335 [Anaerolineae bacterium]|nr:hypothetical protein [Anaerolineae bacterium]
MEREMLLLGLLRNGEMHGYQLNDYIERTPSFCADVKKATAYSCWTRWKAAAG